MCLVVALPVLLLCERSAEVSVIEWPDRVDPALLRILRGVRLDMSVLSSSSSSSSSLISSSSSSPAPASSSSPSLAWELAALLPREVTLREASALPFPAPLPEHAQSPRGILSFLAAAVEHDAGKHGVTIR